MCALPNADAIASKGTPLKAALTFVESRWGDAGVQKVIAALPDETKTVVSGMILPAARYPLRHLVALAETIDKVHGRGDLKLCWEIGRFAGEFEVKLLHRVFLKVAKLEYWLKMAGVTWKNYYTAGVLTANIGKGDGFVTLTDFNPISKAFCYRFGGWVQKVTELSNKRQVRMVHDDCVLDGKPACIWKGTWIE